MARESIVLLKNDGVLPLTKEKNIALIGPKADSTDLLGPWQFSSRTKDTITMLQGMENAGVKVASEAGSGIHDELPGGVDRAVALAKKSDIVILALGEDMSMSGEASSRQNIVIPEAQVKLAKAVMATGVKTVLVLVSGRPLIIDWFDKNCDAVIAAWFPGSEAGRAIADILTGSYNPSAKLSMSFPLNQGQIPVYYNHLNTGRPFKDGETEKFKSRYLDGPNAPLYSFGYGLSYTSFELSDMTLSSDTMEIDKTIIVRANLKNTGKLFGEEVVQLYIRDIAASIARPVKELKGFKKIGLEPGEEREIVFAIDSETLSFWNEENKKVAEKGKFVAMLGTSSRDCDIISKEFSLS